METESWKNYLYIAETILNELTTDQIATCAKMLALELDKYRPCQSYCFFFKTISKLISFTRSEPIHCVSRIS